MYRDIFPGIRRQAIGIIDKILTRTIIHSRQGDNLKERASAQGLVITIDGPAGVGKSTVARLLASRLGYLYLDSGALYRGVAWKVKTAGVEPSDQGAVVELLPMTALTLEPALGCTRVLVDGQDVAEEIRTPEISYVASVVSAYPAVREWLLPVQQRLGAAGGVVAEGRDLGTKVFPGADVKFFLDADVTVRAARRHRDVAAAGQSAELEQTRREIQARDARDRTREEAPLVAAPNACVIDTSTLGVEAVVDRMLAVIATKL